MRLRMRQFVVQFHAKRRLQLIDFAIYKGNFALELGLLSGILDRIQESHRGFLVRLLAVCLFLLLLAVYGSTYVRSLVRTERIHSSVSTGY